MWWLLIAMSIGVGLGFWAGYDIGRSRGYLEATNDHEVFTRKYFGGFR